MKRSLLALSGIGVAFFAANAQSAFSQEKPADTPPKWAATGTLFESCTCAVPCTCNFGQGPSPHRYCYAVYAYRLEKATFDGVDLSGLIVGGADGPDGTSGFLDDRATSAQHAALEKMGAYLFRQGGPSSVPTHWRTAKIVAEDKRESIRLTLGDYGGFSADVLMGRDGVSPIVVENNPIWPIARAAKAKSRRLSLTSPESGKIDGSGTNANFGAFTFGNK